MHDSNWRNAAEPAKKIDLANNTNPLGFPPRAAAAARDSIRLCERYPDASCEELRRAIAAARQLPAGEILCGAGADELIYRICQQVRPRKALIPVPAFEEYENALRLVGCEVVFYPLLPEEGFRLTSEFLHALTAELDLVFLCNPNNPTGTCVSPSLLRQIIWNCEKNNILLVVDECFMGFLEDRESLSCQAFLAQSPHLIVLDAFTKLYALPGLRVGYAMCSNRALLHGLSGQGQAWNVSIPAQAAAIATLQDSEYLRRTRLFLNEERPWLQRALESLGIHPVWGEANFLFFPSPIPNLRTRLEEQGIYIRDCSRFRALPGEYCRVAVKQHSWNEQFLHALTQLLGK